MMYTNQAGVQMSIDVKRRRHGMIVNKTTIPQSSNEGDIKVIICHSTTFNNEKKTLYCMVSYISPSHNKM